MKDFWTKLLSWLGELFHASKTTTQSPTPPTTSSGKATEVLEYLEEDREPVETTPTQEPEPIKNEPDKKTPTSIMKRNVLICLDNGHGEETPGKRSPWSANKVKPELPFREYAYCREIVQELAKVLEEDGYRVFIVVPETTDITLAERGRRINSAVTQARKTGEHALCISVHNNAAGSGKEWKNAYGWSVWTTPGQNNSDILAQCLYDAAINVLKPLGMTTRKDRSDGDDDYEANFAMCRMPNCPAVLTENMFQDCVKEVEFLLSDAGRQAIVEIHRRGIDAFVKRMNW